jgi:hypothetical protein
MQLRNQLFLNRRIPINNMNSHQIPKIADIPKNNYDDRGMDKVKENSRVILRKSSMNDLKQKIELLQVLMINN